MQLELNHFKAHHSKAGRKLISQKWDTSVQKGANTNSDNPVTTMRTLIFLFNFSPLCGIKQFLFNSSDVPMNILFWYSDTLQWMFELFKWELH